MKKLCYIIPFLLLFASCYDDKGNYSYLDLNEIIIDTTGKGIKAVYSVNQFERLNIPVVVNREGRDTSGLEYAWTVFEDNEGSENKDKPVLLSSRPEFDEEISLKSGSYVLLLSVTDRATGVKEEMKFGLKVSALLKSGWLVFYEDGHGGSDVAIINDRVLDPTITSDQVITDLFYKVNGRRLTGTPRDINHLRIQFYPSYQPAIYILTDREGVRVNDQDFSSFGPVGDFFFVRPAVEDYQLHVLYAYGSEYLLNNGKIHSGDLSSNTPATEKKFPVEIWGDYYAEPWLATSCVSPASTVFYDRLFKKFRYVTSYPPGMADFGEQAGAPAFDCRNVGMDMLYMESGFDNLTLALFEDADHKRYLMECNFMDLAQVARNKYSFNGFEGADDAKFFSVGTKGKVFMYANDKKVYSFDYASQTISENEQWKITETGETITCMKLFRGNRLAVLNGSYSYNPNTPYMLGMESKLIFIATYNEDSGEGFVYCCHIDETTGKIDKSTQVKYKGFGKVRAMAHKSPDTNKG